MIRKILFVLMLAGILLAAGCNTIRGIGRDIAVVGDAIADAASD